MAINGPIIAIEVLNFLWAVTGSIINKAFVQDPSNGGAIRECMKDYGLNYTLFAYVWISLGYGQIIRLIVYLACFLYHR